MAESIFLYTDDGGQRNLHLDALHAAIFSIFETRDIDQIALEDLDLSLLPGKSASGKCSQKPLVDTVPSNFSLQMVSLQLTDLR